MLSQNMFKEYIMRRKKEGNTQEEINCDIYNETDEVPLKKNKDDDDDDNSMTFHLASELLTNLKSDFGIIKRNSNSVDSKRLTASQIIAASF